MAVAATTKTVALLDREPEVLEPLQLDFSDLLLLSAPPSASSSPDELERLGSLSGAVIESLGPAGPGLLCITGVPRAPALRRALLPLARKLALLGREDRTRVLKEHALGSDVPLKDLERTVSSYAMQLNFAHDLSLGSPSGGLMSKSVMINDVTKYPDFDSSEELDDDNFEKLGTIFKELGLCMVGLGLRLAQICDKALGCKELAQSIMESGSAKGRLIHYHSTLDTLILKKAKRWKKGPELKVGPAIFHPSPTEQCSISKDLLSNRILIKPTSLPKTHAVNSSSRDGVGRTNSSSLWQQWHYDYGIFTVLTAPSFLLTCQREHCPHISCCKECASPDGHTYLQLFDTKKNKVLVVRAPPDSFIIQVGESANILSSGYLRSTLHSVARPVDIENLTRETFVIFLQPSWHKILAYSGDPMKSEVNYQDLTPSVENLTGVGLFSKVPGSQNSNNYLKEVLAKIPPLSIRFKEGMTFAEFSRETTKQYYGGNGTQSLK